MIKREVYIIASDTYVVKLDGIYKRIYLHEENPNLKISTHYKIGTAKALLTSVKKDKQSYIDLEDITSEEFDNLEVRKVVESYE